MTDTQSVARGALLKAVLLYTFPHSPDQTPVKVRAGQGLPARASAQILCDNNNNSWSEVWENHLKVSRGTDGPAGLLWRVTMVMWIWPYLSNISSHHIQTSHTHMHTRTHSPHWWYHSYITYYRSTHTLIQVCLRIHIKQGSACYVWSICHLFTLSLCSRPMGGPPRSSLP